MTNKMKWFRTIGFGLSIACALIALFTGWVHIGVIATLFNSILGLILVHSH